MHSLMITTAFPPQKGGIQTVIFEIISHLTPEDDVVAMTQAQPNAKPFDTACSFDILRPRLGGWRRFFFRVISFLISPLLAECLLYLGPACQLLQSKRIDFVQCGHIRVGLVAYLLKCRFSIPFVVYTHAQEVVKVAIPCWKLFDRLLRQFVLRKAHTVFVNSEHTRHKVAEWDVQDDRIVKIPFGVDLKRFAVVKESQDRCAPLGLAGRRIILTVGRLVERKGHDIVIKALPQALARFPDLIYVIVGDGPARASLSALVDKSNLSEHVFFAGEVPDDVVIQYYQACDVFIMVSRAHEERGDVEGFGLVYLEANACGKPVIGGRSGGVPDAVLDGVTGVLVDPTDVDDVAAAIIKLLTDKGYTRRLGENGRRRVETEMNWDNTVARVRTRLLNT
jgi:phosphatidylinositol alpha-1,6-mannosyltransferase